MSFSQKTMKISEPNTSREGHLKTGARHKCLARLPLNTQLSTTLVRTSKQPQQYDAWCQLFAKWLEVSAIRERPIHRYSEVDGLGEKGQGLVVMVDFYLTFSFLDVEVEDSRHFL